MRKTAALVALAATGYANAAAKPATAAATREEPKVTTGTIEGFALPPKPRGGGSASKYPFDSLGTGEFFSVGNKSRRQMASPVNNANKKYRSQAKDAAGTVISTTQDREFYSVDVDADLAKKLRGTAHEGAKVLVIRSK